MIWITVAPYLVLADCIELLHLWLQRIWSAWFWYWPFGDVHVQSHLLCCWKKKMFSITSAFSWPNSISSFALLHFVLQDQTFLLLQVSLEFLLLHSSPLWWKWHFFFLLLFLKSLWVFIELFNFSFFSINGWGIDLDYCDIEKASYLVYI